MPPILISVGVTPGVSPARLGADVAMRETARTNAPASRMLRNMACPSIVRANGTQAERNGLEPSRSHIEFLFRTRQVANWRDARRRGVLRHDLRRAPVLDRRQPVRPGANPQAAVGAANTTPC